MADQNKTNQITLVGGKTVKELLQEENDDDAEENESEENILER